LPSPFPITIDAIFAAAARPEVVEAMAALYAEADRRIAALPGTCWNKGECCRFGQYGHRLYVTSLEVAYYLAHLNPHEAQASAPHQSLHPAPWFTPDREQSGKDASAGAGKIPLSLLPRVTEDACPHAFDGRCHVRDFRPLGCRIFYCDHAAQHWQGALTEELLGRLRSMHEQYDVPYLYADWMTFLGALQEAASHDLPPGDA
jgi:hypothetical protein